MVIHLALLLLLSAGPGTVPGTAWDAHDRTNIAEPHERRIAENYDFLLGTVFQPFFKLLDFPRDVRKLLRMPKQAEDINAFDEVPNSTWFTNRNFLTPLSPDEIRRGPSNWNPPDAGPWTIIKCKTDGISPGFQVRDGKGDVYLLKFDSSNYPELTSGAEVVTSRFLYAAGYNVPLDSVVTFDRKILVPKNDLQCTMPNGKKVSMSDGAIDHLLEDVGRTDDGRIRAMASKYLDGVPKGPFSYMGLRNDDPNDKIAHEHRRELRGLRVIAAFLNHVDVKQINTLDMYVSDGGNKYLKHYLIDFGAALGSATLVPKEAGDGEEYFVDPGEMLKSALTVGIYRRPDEREIRVQYPSVGWLPSTDFKPEHWKGDEPIAAFENMTDIDGYWGAKIVASFTDEQIAAAVSAGEYSDPRAEHALIDILKQRRDRVAEYWFRKVAPLDHFRTTSEGIAFDDLALISKLDRPENVKYNVTFATQSSVAVPVTIQSGKAIALPAGDGPFELRVVRSSPGWPDLTARVYVTQSGGVATITRIRR